MSILTVEEVNTTLFREQKCFWYEIDTSKISTTENFTDVPYDFVKVTRETQNSNYAYLFKIDNDYWTNGYYVLKSNGEYYTGDAQIIDGKLVFVLPEDSIRLFLYIGNYKYTVSQYTPSNHIKYLIPNNNYSLTLKQLGQYQTVTVVNLATGGTETHHKKLTVGVYPPLAMHCECINVNLVKSDFQFNCTQQLTVGKVNRVALGTNSDYKPNGSMIGTNTPTITIEYDGETIPAEWDYTRNDYCFDIDLTNKRSIGKIRFKVNIESNKVINASETTVVLQCNYQNVSNFDELVSACARKGNEIINVTADINFSNDIQVVHPIKIIGDNVTFNMNSHSIILNEGIQFDAENISFNVGDIAILQKNNSKVTLTNCNFTNCTSSNYNDLGSCILCDTDMENLDNPNDFETILNNCTFTNNTSCILHNGQLTIDKSQFTNNDTDYANINNVAFLYQTDGDAVITNSNFDIDYDTDDFCSNQQNIGFAQCILKCGETATINGASYVELGDNNTLPFFTQTFNNQAHLFAKYYYPQIESCVYSQAIDNYENKSCCHCVSGVDWAFKNNVQITRVGDD